MYEGTESWADWMVVRLPIEKELMIEAGSRELKGLELNDLQDIATALIRQNAVQSQVVSQCIDKITELEARIVCSENRVKQPSRKALFRFLRREDQ